MDRPKKEKPLEQSTLMYVKICERAAGGWFQNMHLYHLKWPLLLSN